jgi:gamma-glutamyltranspeptidase/glutathione hydrolase
MICAATDGTVQPEDLATSQADWIEPISIEVMGHRAWTIPPNSQGYLTLAAAWLFEKLNPPRDVADPLFTHAAIEAYRAVAWERDLYVADPEHSPADPLSLLDPERLARRLPHIDMRSRAEWPTSQPAPGGTAYLCVRDAAGMGVSFIQSNYHGIGSTLGAGSAGFFLHDRGSGFCLVPGHPNELAPGKRPLHTLSPTLWTRDGSLAMLLGTRGGDFQPQTLLQMITFMLWANHSGTEAQAVPRWVTKEWRGGDSTIQYEPGYPASSIAHLADLGHNLAATDQPMGGWGPVSAITVTDDGATGAADPRVATTAALGI